MRKIEHQVINGVEYKKCSKCGEWKPLSEFYKCKTSWDNLQSKCKGCDSQHKSQCYQDNKDEILANGKQYYLENKVKILERSKQHYIINKEKKLEYGKHRRNTEYGYAYQVRYDNLKADKKRGWCAVLPSNYPTVEDYIKLLSQPDHYDGKQYSFTEMGVDRIDNNKPHTIDNIVPCSTKNNVKRHTMNYEVFKELLENENNINKNSK